MVAFLRLFATLEQPLVGYWHKAENCIVASYGPEENRREVQVVTSEKIPFDVERHPADELFEKPKGTA